jgi:hypothetical protein
MHRSPITEVVSGLQRGELVPYLGPGMLELVAGGSPVPADPQRLVARLTAKVAVPHKIRTRLTAAAQFIENFKHRATLVAQMKECFAHSPPPALLHEWLASLPLPMLVSEWYDGTMAAALAARTEWGRVQGLSQSEHFGTWFQHYDAQGRPCGAEAAAHWRTLLYQPIGSVEPAANFLVSDSDFVEVLTEIDIQTPIPPRVQELRAGRGFLFLGCRFQEQLQRSFARQILKRSAGPHWAVLAGELTRNEARFLKEQGIERIDLPLQDFEACVAREVTPALA